MNCLKKIVVVISIFGSHLFAMEGNSISTTETTLIAFEFNPPMEEKTNPVNSCLKKCQAETPYPFTQLVSFLREAYNDRRKISVTFVQIDESSWKQCEEMIYQENPDYLSAIANMKILYKSDYKGKFIYADREDVISFYRYIFRVGHHFTSVESLHFGCCHPFAFNVYDEMIEHIASEEGLPNLKEIHFERFPHIREAGIVALSKFQYLERLSFNFINRGYGVARYSEDFGDPVKEKINHFSAEELSLLGRITSLQQLKISYPAKMLPDTLDYLSSLTNLCVLDIFCGFCFALNAIPASFVNLHHLKLSRILFIEEYPFPDLPNLTHLFFESCGVMTNRDAEKTEEGKLENQKKRELVARNFLQSLSSMEQLEELSLTNCGFVTDIESLVHCLVKFTKLIKLDLSSCSRGYALSTLSNEHLKQLGCLQGLESLNLMVQDKFDDTGLLYLKELPHLASLNLFGNALVTLEGIKDLLTYMPHLRILFDQKKGGERKKNRDYVMGAHDYIGHDFLQVNETAGLNCGGEIYGVEDEKHGWA